MVANSSIQQPVFEIAPEVQSQSWTSSRNYSSSWAQWNSYINQICLQTFLPFLIDLNATSSISFHDWKHHNGCSIKIAQKRLILIPALSLDMSEIKVAQIWVDDPAHMGDYYVAVQVDPDDEWIKFWGYTTHRQLKAIAEYSSRDRCYFLAIDHLIRDITVFAVAQQLCPNETTKFVA